jgi:hypothetical protein
MIVAEIRKSPMREESQVMEALWENIRGAVGNHEMSESDKVLLDRRRARVDAGEEKLLGWEDVRNKWGGK